MALNMQPKKKNTTWFLIHETGSATNNKEKRHASPLILLQITNQTNIFFPENPTKMSSQPTIFPLLFHLPIPPAPSTDGEGKEARGNSRTRCSFLLNTKGERCLSHQLNMPNAPNAGNLSTPLKKCWRLERNGTKLASSAGCATRG
ncbi:hypothetical protein NPIL_665631 [Nephila pilipes]|uniref:Uncharacterized protein n=1 Tax=Nephila pilipes TaxID=299642 RepID=A0A8X6UKC6_NEPPI|nr:hypothetical protein NPIL_665631 [Nephila pilipes]